MKKPPKKLDELRFVENLTNAVQEKMKHTRLLKGTRDSVVKKLFETRVGEVESLKRLCKIIKKYIKQNKQMIINY